MTQTSSHPSIATCHQVSVSAVGEICGRLQSCKIRPSSVAVSNHCLRLCPTRDHPAVGTSGLSFRSDRPLLTAGSSSGTSPEGKLQPPVAGVEACPPHTKQQQGSGQQGAGGGMRYSDQYLPDSPERHNRDGAATRQDAIQAGRQQQQHLPAVVIAAANNNTGDGGDGQERSGVGGPDLTLNGDIAMQVWFLQCIQKLPCCARLMPRADLHCPSNRRSRLHTPPLAAASSGAPAREGRMQQHCHRRICRSPS